MENLDINKMGLEEVLKEIETLNYDRVYNGTKLYFLKENYLRSYNEKDKEDISEIEKMIKELDDKLAPLFVRLRNLQTPYIVQYEGEFSNGRGQVYWETQTEYLHLKTQCNIDTWTTALDYNNPTVRDLMTEIHNFLLRNRFTNFRIKNVKKHLHS